MLDRLVWKSDRVLLDDLVFRLVLSKSDQWELGEECLALYKSKPLVDEYARYWQTKGNFLPRNIFELGILDGGSVVFWYELFHPQKHVAIDLKSREDSPYFQHYVASRGLADKVKTYWGTDQGDSVRLREIVAREFDAPLDLVVDDASHLYEGTKKSFETLFPLMRPGGLYIMEDWAWAHWKDFQAPGHIWANQVALSKLVLQLVQAAGGFPRFSPSVEVRHGFAIVERGVMSATELEGFQLEQFITLREQDKVEQLLSRQVERQREELAREKMEQARLQERLASEGEKLNRVRHQYAGLLAELKWTRERLEQMQATRLWHLGELYWRAHARVKSMFRS